jgi:hypothetical protein
MSFRNLEQVPGPLVAAACAVVGTASVYALRNALRSRAYAKHTVLAELETLGRPRVDGAKIGARAVICGGRWALDCTSLRAPLTMPPQRRRSDGRARVRGALRRGGRH